MIKQSYSNPLTEKNLNIQSMWFICPGCHLHWFLMFTLFILLKILILYFPQLVTKIVAKTLKSYDKDAQVGSVGTYKCVYMGQ